MKLGELRALIVDDDRQVTETVRSILMGIGARSIVLAGSAAAAKARLAEHAFDVVIVDQDLSDPREAIDLVRQIRAGGVNAAQTLPVLMMVTVPDRARIVEARDAGVNEIISKPFSSGGFLARLEKMVEAPRPFVRAESYTGPDRRRRADPEFPGPERRKGAELGERPSRPAARKATPKLESRSVLIIDDDPINRMVIQSTVEHLGCRAQLANDGESALRYLKADKFDVVLADIHMPQMDGRQVVEMLRKAEGPNREVPVVALTCDLTLSHRDLAPLGFDAFVPKPFSIPMMREALVARRTSR